MFGNGKVFVSHSHADNAACEPVRAALDAWQVDYWFDTAELSAGLVLFDTIQRALQDRDIFIRICTPAALASPWMTQEQKLARSLRAPNGGKRRIINLILQHGYVSPPDEADALTIDAPRTPQVEWLRRLREALEIPSRERHISRRAVIGLGVTSLAALGGLGLAGKALLAQAASAPPSFRPTSYQPTPTALPGVSRIRWQRMISPNVGGEANTIALAGENILVTSYADNTITSVSASSGALGWIQQYGDDINTHVPMTVANGLAYITYIESKTVGGNTQYNVYLDAINVSDGSERWTQVVLSSPTYILQLTSAVAAAGGITYVRCNQSLYAFATATGKPLWSQSAGAAPVDPDEILPSPVVAGNAVYAVLGDGALHAFSATSGAPLWGTPFKPGGPIHPRPVVGDSLVYVASDDGYCYALDATTAAVRWKAPLPSNPDPSGIIAPTVLGLTLADGVLYTCGGVPALNTTTSVQALDAATGKQLWATQPEAQMNLGSLQTDIFRADPLVVGGDVIVATRLGAANGRNENIVYALDTASGKLKWSFQMWGTLIPDGAGASPSAPIVTGDSLYILSGNETLYALSYAD